MQKTPVFTGSELAGMITLGNFSKNQANITLLFTLAFYLSSLMQRGALPQKDAPAILRCAYGQSESGGLQERERQAFFRVGATGILTLVL